MCKNNLLVLFILSLILSLSACSSPDEVNIKNDEPFIFIKEILPSNPSTGDILRIILSEQLTGNKYDGFVFFDNKWSYSDSVKNDTIFTFMPYIKEKKSVEVKLNINFKERQDVLTKIISVNNLCTQSVCVLNNNEGTIHEKDIYPKDMISKNSKWEINKDSDTITFSSFMIIGDESNLNMKIKFLKGIENNLPRFISFIIIRNESDGSSPSVNICDTLENGIVKIEDWNKNGIYSGIVYAELEPFESKSNFPPRTVFWLNPQSQ